MLWKIVFIELIKNYGHLSISIYPHSANYQTASYYLSMKRTCIYQAQ